MNGEELIIYEKNYYDAADGRLLEPVETPNYLLIQIGDSFYRKKLAMPAHAQFFDLELTFAVERTAEVYADDTPTRIKKGEAYLSYAGERHRIAAAQGFRFQYFAVNVRGNSPCRELLMRLKAERTAKNRRALACPRLSGLLSELLAETKRERPDPLRIDALVTESLFALVRAEEPERAYRLYSPEDLVPDIANYIDRNFLSLRSLAPLADHYGYTYGYLSELFRKRYGIGIKRYLTDRKNAYADKLLSEGKSVTEAAEILGYSSVYNFSRAYKAATGTPPSTHKIQMKTEA